MRRNKSRCCGVFESFTTQNTKFNNFIFPTFNAVQLRDCKMIIMQNKAIASILSTKTSELFCFNYSLLTMIFYLSSLVSPRTRMLNNLLSLIKHIILQRKPQTSKISLIDHNFPSSWHLLEQFIWQVLNWRNFWWNFPKFSKLSPLSEFIFSFVVEPWKPVNILHSIYSGNFIWKFNFPWCSRSRLMVDNKFSIATAVVWVIRCVLILRISVPSDLPRAIFGYFVQMVRVSSYLKTCSMTKMSSRGWFFQLFLLRRQQDNSDETTRRRCWCSVNCKINKQVRFFAGFFISLGNWFAFELFILEFSTSTVNGIRHHRATTRVIGY